VSPFAVDDKWRIKYGESSEQYYYVSHLSLEILSRIDKSFTIATYRHISWDKGNVLKSTERGSSNL
jgi:hypothetical protein